MAEQIPGNFAATAVAAGGYTSGSGILNVASTATPFPATGAFSVVVMNAANDPPTPRGVLRIATIASATQWTVAAEGADFNANAGDPVYAVISSAALTALLGSVAGATAFSAITGATNTSAAMVVGTGASLAASGSGTIAATTAANIAANTGTTTTVLHGNAAGNPSFGAVSLVNDVTGNLGVSHLNSGTSASSSTYWRGDGTWAPATGGGAASGSAFTPVNNQTGNVTNWQNFSILAAIRGESLSSFPTSWKVRMRFTAGSPVIGGMKILRTLSQDTTVIDSTTVTIGSVANPTLSSPSLVETDAISLTTDSTHDYWFVIFFTNTGANASVGVIDSGPLNLSAGYAAGDQTGASTIPSVTYTNAPYLIYCGINA